MSNSTHSDERGCRLLRARCSHRLWHGKGAFLLSLLVGACGCRQEEATPAQMPGIALASGGATTAFASLSEALCGARNGDTILVGDACHEEPLCFTSTPLLTGGDSCSILGCGRPVILVTLTNVSYANVCGINLMGTHGLLVSNVHFRILCRVNNTPNTYGGWFAGCTNLLVQDCTFQVEVYGTNNVVKSLVFTEGASNVIVRNSVVVTLDMTGSNEVFHTASHDASPPLFSNVSFVSKGLEALEVGDIALADCVCNETPIRQVGRRFGMLGIDPAIDPAPYLLAPDEVLPVLDRFCEWTCWTGDEDSKRARSCVQRSASFIRIVNPHSLMVGLQHAVHVDSNSVYRVTGTARSLATTDPSVPFGGRVAVCLPPQPERDLVWMSECTNWWRKELVFTNQVTGTAVVYVHMGYGNVASTGEFTDIRLERIE